MVCRQWFAGTIFGYPKTAPAIKKGEPVYTTNACGGKSELVSSLLGPYLISVKGRGSCSGQGSPANAATATEQPAEQSSAAGPDADIDQVAVTAIETRTAVVTAIIVITGCTVGRRAVIRVAIAAAAFVIAVTAIAITVVVTVVTPVLVTLPVTTLPVCGEW